MLLWLLWTSVDPALSSVFGTFSSGAAVVAASACAVVEPVLTLDGVVAAMGVVGSAAGGVVGSAAGGVVGSGLH